MSDGLVCCETPTAIMVHLRKLADGEVPNPRGNRGSRTLCGRSVGWDLPNVEQASCRDCVMRAREEPKQ